MALDSWLIRVRSALSSATTAKSTAANRPIIQKPPTIIGILCCEVAGIMSKLLHLWRSLSDHHLLLLHRDSISLPGIRKLISDDDAFLLSLACAEFTDSLRVAADSISLVLSHRCTDQTLRRFHRRFHEYAEQGRDDEGWVMGWREMEAKVKKMEKFVAATGELHRELDEMVDMEQCLKRLLVHSSNSASSKMAAAVAVRRKISWKKQEVKRLKEMSLWEKNFDTISLVLARSAFTVLARIKQVFHSSEYESPSPSPSPPPPRLSVSAAVHPSSDTSPISNGRVVEEPIASPSKNQQLGFFESSSAALVRLPSTLGCAGLALRYANIVLVIEKMIRSPRSIGPDARDDLYSMLPASLRSTLRARLRRVAACPATDVRLANEWQTALGMIVDWLSPLAHNTVRWQSERSFERRGASTATAPARSGVLVLQTLHFAVREKAEAAVAELLVGLNYVWRFEMEMAMKAKAKAAVLLTPAGAPAG